MFENYLDVANSGLMFTVAAIIVLFVLFGSGLLLVMAIKRGKEIGITNKQIWTVVRPVVIVAALGTISVALGFMTIAPTLGIPVSWARLSIIGSYTVEAGAAQIGAVAAGAPELGGAGFSAEAFSSAVWAMTFGTMWYLLLTPFLLKKLKTSVSKKSKGGDQKWTMIVGNSLMFSLISIFAVQDFIKGGDARLTVIIGGVIAALLTIGLNKFKQLKCLKEYKLPIVLIACMIIMFVISWVRL